MDPLTRDRNGYRRAANQAAEEIWKLIYDIQREVEEVEQEEENDAAGDELAISNIAVVIDAAMDKVLAATGRGGVSRAEAEQQSRDYHRFQCNRCQRNPSRPQLDEWGRTDGQ